MAQAYQLYRTKTPLSLQIPEATSLNIYKPIEALVANLPFSFNPVLHFMTGCKTSALRNISFRVMETSKNSF